MIYDQYLSSPFGLSYLVGDVMPWDDYVVFCSVQNTSVCVYGRCDESGVFHDPTIRTVTRNSGSGYSTYYSTTEEFYSGEVIVAVDEPYYAYGNLIGVNYDLPSASVVQSAIVSVTCVLCALFSVLRLCFRLKKR